jgi:putative hemolysin
VDPLFWVVAGSAALSCFFGVTSYSLRVARRSQLEEAFAGASGKKRLGALEAQLPALRLTTSFLRSLSNLILTVAVLFAFRPWDRGPWALVGAMATAAGVITVCGVVIPQAWASYAGEKVLAATLGVLVACRYLLYPVVAVMRAFDVPIRRLAGAPEREDENGEAAKAEILQAATEGQAEGAVDAEEVEMIESVMEFGETCVSEIMTPRTDVFAVPVETPLKTACDQIVKAGHTRVPVYEGDLDNIIGVLYAKDLLQLIGTTEDVPLRELMREPYFVPETKPLDDLLREFKRRKVHIAVVLDEYGGTSGLATIEDLLEEIVGDISDEYDHTEPEQMEQVDERTVEVDARMHIDDVNDALGLELPEDEDYDTIAGFVYAKLGYIPAVGEMLDSDGARITVLAADERKLTRLRVERRDGGEAGRGSRRAGRPRPGPRELPAHRADEEAELLELGGQVHGAAGDVRRGLERGGGEVEDALHAGLRQQIGHLLSGFGRHGHYRQLDVLFPDDPRQLAKVTDGDLPGEAADLRGGDVERGHQLEALLSEALVSQKGPAEVAGANHDHVPGLVGAEDPPKLVDQRPDAVSHARPAELAEVGQVLSHLGGGDLEAVGQAAGGDLLHALGAEVLQLPEVEAQPADDRGGDGLALHSASRLDETFLPLAAGAGPCRRVRRRPPASRAGAWSDVILDSAVMIGATCSSVKAGRGPGPRRTARGRASAAPGPGPARRPIRPCPSGLPTARGRAG